MTTRSLDGLRDLFSSIPPLTEGKPGWATFSLEVLVQVLRFSKKRNLAAGPLAAYIDLLNAAISEMDPQPDTSGVCLVRREKGGIDQALLPRIGLSKDGSAIVMQFANLEVPVIQDGASLSVGTLASEDAFALVPDSEGREQKTAEGEDAKPRRYEHKITLTDKETGDEYEILLLTRTDIEVKGPTLQKALAAGKSLTDMLRPLPSGEGGGKLAVSMKDWVRDNEIQCPASFKVVGYRKVPSKSKYRSLPYSWAMILDNGDVVFARGGSEAFLDQHSEHLDNLLSEMGHLVLKIGDVDFSDEQKVRIKCWIELPMEGLEELKELQSLVLSGQAAATKSIAAAKEEAATPAEKPKKKAAAVAVAEREPEPEVEEAAELSAEDQEDVDILGELGFD